MKKEEPNHSFLFLAVTLFPSLLVVIIFFMSTSNLQASDEEAMQNGFLFAVWFLVVMTILRVIFDNDLSLRLVSLYAIATTSLAMVSLYFGLGNQIILLVVSFLGLLVSFGTAHYLEAEQTKKHAEYLFVSISIICCTLANLVFGLALTNRFNLMQIISQML